MNNREARLWCKVRRMEIALIMLLALCPWARAGSEQVTWNGIVFHVVVTEPEKVELYWKDEAGKTFRQFRVLQEHLRGQGRRIAFIMNGGLFEEDGSPCGLLVIGGKILRPLNLRDGEGNFYLKPNGVFYIHDKAAHVVSSETYARLAPEAKLAIQSGPLLLEKGKVHPAFSPTSKWALHRNGVGVRKDGKVVFAITEFDQKRRVTLYQFAEFFRSQGCENALFLDGDISGMLTDVRGDIPSGNFFGTIFAITESVK